MESQIDVVNVLESDQTIARLWNDQQVKTELISQIMEQRQSNSLEPKKINEKDLIIHYFNAWLKVDSKDYIKKLLGHPLISVSDYDKVSQIVKEQEDKRNLYSVGMTCVQLAFYSLFMNKHRVFYNFFRKNHHFKYLRTFKQLSCCFLLLTTNVSGFEYFISKRTPVILDKQNYFQKYNIQFNID